VLIAIAWLATGAAKKSTAHHECCSSADLPILPIHLLNFSTIDRANFLSLLSCRMIPPHFLNSLFFQPFQTALVAVAPNRLSP